MQFELSEEHRMLKDLVARFVKDELMPLEAGVMQREASGEGVGIDPADQARLDAGGRTRLGNRGAVGAARERTERNPS